MQSPKLISLSCALGDVSSSNSAENHALHQLAFYAGVATVEDFLTAEMLVKYVAAQFPRDPLYGWASTILTKCEQALDSFQTARAQGVLTRSSQGQGRGAVTIGKSLRVNGFWGIVCPLTLPLDRALNVTSQCLGTSECEILR